MKKSHPGVRARAIFRKIVLGHGGENYRGFFFAIFLLLDLAGAAFGLEVFFLGVREGTALVAGFFGGDLSGLFAAFFLGTGLLFVGAFAAAFLGAAATSADFGRGEDFLVVAFFAVSEGDVAFEEGGTFEGLAEVSGFANLVELGFVGVALDSGFVDSNFERLLSGAELTFVAAGLVSLVTDPLGALASLGFEVGAFWTVASAFSGTSASFCALSPRRLSMRSASC